ncbi:hypothetical protein MLD38_039884 [Melastoma candidum]|nr:hypothetical protein MLD38_039884 [Melastoma candidum]
MPYISPYSDFSRLRPGEVSDLVAVPRFPRRNAPASRSDGDRSVEDDDQEDVRGTENEEDWDDVEDIFNGDDGLEDEDGDEDNGDDSWSDEDGDTPPDFSEDDDYVKIHIIDGSSKQAQNSRYKQEEELEPIFPDRRPRERW